MAACARLSLLLMAALLAACSPYTEPPEGPYAGVLKRGESVTDATPEGPFTALSILYRQGGGYLTSTEIASKRLLYRDRVLIRDAEDLTRWAGLAQPVYVVEVFEKHERVLKLAYERDGKAVVQPVAAGAFQYRATRAFPHGFPMAPGLLYFPGQLQPGLLLRALPVKTTVLPDPLAGRYSLHANTLAAVSPDGTSFALVDSEDAPSVVLVADADGGYRDAIGLPRTYLAEALDEHVNPYERVWSWARTSLAWRKNADGKWEVQPMAQVKAGANPVEELFIDEQSGYAQCFAAGQAGCLQDWRAAKAADLSKMFGQDYAPPFAYVPNATVQAFGAHVSMLLFARLGLSGTGYSVYLDGSQDAIVAQLSARLKERHIPFVRVDQCPRRTDALGKCEAQLAEKLQRPESVGRELEQLINSMDGQSGVLLILPSMAIVVRAREEGGALIQTLLRADFSRKD